LGIGHRAFSGLFFMSEEEERVEHVSELIKLSSEMINKTDHINQRLVQALIISVIAFSLCLTITLVGISYFYFTTDYGFGTVNQTQTNTENSNQNINKGVK
jgi:hypothetical protein